VYSQIFLLCLFLTKPATSSAFDEKNNITMATMEQIPYGFWTDNGKPTGVLYEVLNRIMIESDIKQPNNILSIKRLLATMLTNKNTCSLLGDTPEVVNKHDLIEPIGLSVKTGILPKSGVILVDYSSLKGLTIAVPQDINFDKKLNEYKDKDFSIITPRNYVNALKMLKSGQVDAVAGAISTLKFIGIKEGMTATYFDHPLILSHIEITLICNYGLPTEARKELKNAVITLRTNGNIQNILDRYFDKMRIEPKSKFQKTHYFHNKKAIKILSSHYQM